MSIDKCEFCAEINGCESRFHRHYHDILSTRILVEEAGFIVMPSMGQIVPGSLMLLPRDHVERFADLTTQRRQAAEHVLDNTIERCSSPVAVFEHGARSCTGGSCGIYHAHMHIIPLPKGVYAENLSHDLEEQTLPVSEVWNDLANDDEYLLLLNGEGGVWARPVAASERARFPSQYFRRLLAHVCANGSSWDWRTVPQPEPMLIDALKAWGAP